MWKSIANWPWWDTVIQALFGLFLISVLATQQRPNAPDTPSPQKEQEAVHGMDDEIVYKDPNQVIARYTVGLFYATVVMAVVAFFQGIYIIRADRHTKRSVDAFLASEAGYLEFGDVSIIIGEEESITFNFKNYGATKLTVRKYVFHAEYSDEIPKTKEQAAKAVDFLKEENTVLFVKSKQRIKNRRTKYVPNPLGGNKVAIEKGVLKWHRPHLSNGISIWDDIERGHKFLYIVGWIEYETVFGDRFRKNIATAYKSGYGFDRSKMDHLNDTIKLKRVT